MPICLTHGRMVNISSYGHEAPTRDDEEMRYNARIDREAGTVTVTSSRRSGQSDWIWSRDKKVATLPIELFEEYARGLKLEETKT